MLDRRSFLVSSAAIAAGSFAAPLLAQTVKSNVFCYPSPNGPTKCSSPTPPPQINPSIIQAHFTTAQNLQTSLFSSGATAAAISSHATAASTLFAEAARIGTTSNINSNISANASALTAFGTSLTDAQLQTLYTSLLPLFPGLTLGQIDIALSELIVPSGTAQNLTTQGVIPQQNSFLALLGQAASSVGGGVIVASDGVRQDRAPNLMDASCALYYVAVFLLGASSFLTDGLSAGVVWGVEVTWSQIFGGAAMLGGALAGLFRC